ncbi:MAG: hypothetical protein H6574_18030 [Lewinellaceae bacterium]|nr:hypothetical protein [Saprospiraceae bacterium]MCB9332971.1 hypothetical protein [Lewinellaceae bacterium]
MRQNLPLLLCVALCFTSACTHYYYAPNSLQTPFLQEKHDTRASIGFIGGDEFSGWEASACYSPVKYGALLVNHFQVKHVRPDDNPEREYGNGRLTELALGGYYPTKNNMNLSFFGGWGGGHVFNVYSGGAESDLRFERIFLQPGLAVQGNKARFSLASRFNRLNYISGNVNLATQGEEISTIQNIENANPFYFQEIGLSVGAGTEPVWVDFRLNINTKEQLRKFGFAKYTVGISFQFELDYLWRKKDRSHQMNSFNID